MLLKQKFILVLFFFLFFFKAVQTPLFAEKKHEIAFTGSPPLPGIRKLPAFYLFY